MKLRIFIRLALAAALLAGTIVYLQVQSANPAVSSNARSFALARAEICANAELAALASQATDVQYHEATAKSAAWLEYLGPVQTVSVALQTGPVHYDGAATAQKSWAGMPEPWVIYRANSRMSVSHVIKGDCDVLDEWAFRFHGWCKKEPTPTTVYDTPCNYDLRDAWLGRKLCGPLINCGASAPWGKRDFYKANDNDVIFEGLFHLDGTTLISHISVVDRFKYRFVEPDHLTSSYNTCSWWVYHEYGFPAEIGEGSSGCTGEWVIN